jgi:predicted nuclease of predicted toxin-antitoxin system
MKFLADMGISMTVVRNLRESGYDAIHLREEGLQRLPDLNIVEKARQENRVMKEQAIALAHSAAA